MEEILNSNWILLAVAAMNVITTWLAWKTHRLTRQVEVATNSMKDALVRKTGEAAFLSGKSEGLAEGKLKK